MLCTLNAWRWRRKTISCHWNLRIKYEGIRSQCLLLPHQRNSSTSAWKENICFTRCTQGQNVTSLPRIPFQLSCLPQPSFSSHFKRKHQNLKWMNGKVFVAQSCLTLCDPTDCSPPGSSVQGILKARILEWVAISFPKGSFRPRDWSCVSCSAGRQTLYHWATREAQMLCK